MADKTMNQTILSLIRPLAGGRTPAETRWSGGRDRGGVRPTTLGLTFLSSLWLVSCVGLGFPAESGVRVKGELRVEAQPCMLQLLDADSGELLQEKRISGRFLVTFLLPPKGGVYQVAVQCEGGAST